MELSDRNIDLDFSTFKVSHFIMSLAAMEASSQWFV